jgi:hypothetical protein
MCNYIRFGSVNTLVFLDSLRRRQCQRLQEPGPGTLNRRWQVLGWAARGWRTGRHIAGTHWTPVVRSPSSTRNYC